MADEIEDFVITSKEHRLYKKFQKHIENFYKVKINMPRVAASDSDIVFISLNGEESCRNGAKKFVLDKMLNQNNVQHEGNVLIVTLSDSSDDESTSADEDVLETPSSNSAAASNSLREESVLIINEPAKAASNSSHDESVLIIDDPVSSLLNTQEKPIKRGDLLEDSICIIESPKKSLQPCKANTKRSKRRKKRILMSNKKVRLSVNFYSDADASELHDITGIRDSMARIEIIGESKPFSESPASLQHSSDFIPIFDLGKNNFKRHKSAFNHQSRQGKMNEGEITVIEPCSVNKNINSLPPTLPSTQNEKNEEIGRIEKIDRNMTTYSPRPVVIDGSNVAREHGKVSHCFSAKGIQLAINYFLNRGHTQVTAFIPKFRQHFNPKHTVPTMNAEIIEELSKKQLVVFTPSRRVNGKIIQSYDDRFIVDLASRNGGVIVSNDNYRDLLDENDSFKEAIEKRLLMFCFVGDEFMVPHDPLGRDGPKLEEFLSFPPRNAVT